MRNRSDSGDVFLVAFVALFTVSILSFVVWVNTMCVDWLTNYWTGKDVPWYVDMVIGIVGNAFVIPFTIITWILSFFI